MYLGLCTLPFCCYQYADRHKIHAYVMQTKHYACDYKLKFYTGSAIAYLVSLIASSINTAHRSRAARNSKCSIGSVHNNIILMVNTKK